ncbi:zinc finger matrin-type protein 3-like isoform X2 [Eriocheir sinensis]|uniref:zinc finger matrin-type protein 3-like isoform X2 n=1 Tax=Eriocheir sinensis TaxID=95602 RepID=UPI0021C9252A|nr:zinc finger matrin-type protein 3-like isoform X2 [Eriocheir sinensis]
MPGMYGPSRSPYGNYGNYWGGYSRPPHPPPPPPMPPHEPPTFHPPPPPPPHFRPMRPPPHALRPPPPPPPIRLPRPPQQQPYPHQHPPSRQPHYRQDRKMSMPPPHRPPPPDHPSNQPYSRLRHSNGSLPPRRGGEFGHQSEKPDSEPAPSKPEEPTVGSPLVSRNKEPEPPPSSPTNKSSPPNNKRPLPVELDPNLPEELVAKFHNNSCELCEVKLNSRIQAKNHYEGKQHRKKVKNYVVENARKDGQPPAKIAKLDISTSKKKLEPLDVSQLYCKCCDLSFTSEQHAQQHYMGRNHQRVLHGLKPLKAGYYNKETGKWQRMPPDPRVSVERLGLNMEPTSEDESGETPRKPIDPDCVKERGRFFCELCNVSATSQDQLDGHITGQRHLKAVRLHAKKTSATATGPSDSILASVIKADEAKKTKSKDLSIYRTPSGKYYCSPCDLTLNSESQFAQHVESKKHKTRRIK